MRLGRYGISSYLCRPTIDQQIMKQLLTTVLSLLCLLVFTACNDYETYGDKKEKERKAIRDFISVEGINVISESQFKENGYVTDTTRNEYVYLNNTGVYMQIMNKGCGTPVLDGEVSDLLIRFVEISLLDSSAVFNDSSPYDVDVMNVRRTGNTYTASFTAGLMLTTYRSESVPPGWLVPFSYINVGRPRSATDHIAKVRLIVPHSQGHSIATSYVYPYFYQISYQRKTDL